MSVLSWLHRLTDRLVPTGRILDPEDCLDEPREPVRVTLHTTPRPSVFPPPVCVGRVKPRLGASAVRRRLLDEVSTQDMPQPMRRGVMMDRFFVYDPECGFETYATAKEAEEAAEGILEAYRDDAGDGWDECVTNLCWGEIREQAVQTDCNPAPEGSAFDEYWDFGLVSVTSDPCEVGHG